MLFIGGLGGALIGNLAGQWQDKAKRLNMIKTIKTGTTKPSWMWLLKIGMRIPAKIQAPRKSYTVSHFLNVRGRDPSR